MYLKRTGPAYVTLADGSILSRSDLPPSSTVRWVMRRKAVVVQAVVAGLIDKAEACETYDLSQEELSDWINKAKSHGVAALKTTKLQKYRQL